MTLDELIAALQEAKEHYVPGKSTVILHMDGVGVIHKVEYDDKNVIITANTI